MKVYLYAKSGHTVGLEATKRCAAIANLLKDFDPVLCTSDFRAGAFAKDNLNVKKYVNIDVVRNLHNIMQRRDILIFDTSEANEEMKKDMKEFCTLLYNLNENPNDIIVDTNLYTKNDTPTIEKTIFFGDDDYYNIFLEMSKRIEKKEINLLMGHYFFLGNEKIFSNHFSNIIDEEEYVDTICNTKYLLTGSLQSALESLSCGNFPVLIKREDKEYNIELIEQLNLPVIEETNLDTILNKFDEIINDYPLISNFNIKDFDYIAKQIKDKIDLFSKLTDIQ